jgi:hypothetical protein
MDLSKLKSITNSYQDVRLLSLKDWKRAREFEPRDDGGPYMVSQEGYDPEETRPVLDEFVLGRSGEWVRLSLFFRLPGETRRNEFVFGMAAEVMELMESLPSNKIKLVRSAQELEDLLHPEAEADDLTEAVLAARQEQQRKRGLE